ncbi:MAG: hypothetical protein NC127_05570 [Muribaculum sp.]|nr:hypothetical protein [Muribaculum sp.]
MFRLFYTAILFLIISCLATGCIEDGFTANPSDQPEYSTDTLSLGTVFTAEGTPTHSFKVYNRHDKGLVLSDISFRSQSDADIFRLNVDGLSGKSFSNVEIRANDSIFVLVEATLPENDRPLPVEIEALLDFTVNGRTSTVVLNAVGQDVERLRGHVVSTSEALSPTKPYQIFDSLVIASGATLTVPAGSMLYFHSGAELRVHGSLKIEGTPEAPVNLTGDRFGQVVGRIPYEIMSDQWGGIRFFATSRDNQISHASIRNTSFGVMLESNGEATPSVDLTLINSQLRNSAGSVLSADNASVVALGCEFAEAPTGVVALYNGRHTFNHCTFANNYLFSAISGAMLEIGGDEVSVEVSNSIIYGIGQQIAPADISEMDITFRRTMLKPSGSDDNNFIDCFWDADPLFKTVRSDYYFDYRLQDDSPAIGVADASLTDPRTAVDFYGLPRGTAPDLGAYVYTPAEE